MNALLSLLILAISPDAPIGERFPQATEVFRAVFDESGDRDFDRWPDLWTRHRGPGFPPYLRIEIVEESPPGGGRSVRMDLDSGAAAVTSPPVPANADYEYALEGYLRTEGLQADRAFLSLSLTDALYKPIDTAVSQKIQDSGGWKRVRIGPVAPSSQSVRHAVATLHLEPLSPNRADLTGAAWFGNLRLVRMPRVVLGTTGGLGIFSHPGDIEVQCRVSGFVRPISSVRFELTDVFGHVLATADRPVRLQKPAAVQVALKPSKSNAGDTTLFDAAAPGAVPSAADGVGAGGGPIASGTCSWKPPVPGPGFYRVRTILRDGSAVLHRETTVAVPRDFPRRSSGEFGWSLSGASFPFPRTHLTTLLTQSGIHWVKCPVWLPADATPASVADLEDLLERISLHGIRIVGVLEQAPVAGKPLLSPETMPAIAETFTLDREEWQPSLEATVVRLGGSIHWWQLGNDADVSFMGYVRLPEKIAQIRNELRRVEHQLQIGLCWDFNREMPPDGNKSPWRFLSLHSEPALTAAELSRYLTAPATPTAAQAAATPAGSSTRRAEKPSPWMAGALENEAQRWVMLEPIDAATYSTADRATDLVRRMIAARAGGASAVFASKPFDDLHGLMHADGTPGELYLPWRNTAMVIAGRECLGEMTLPERCFNRVFAGRADAVMVVWNPRKVRVAAYLGEEVHHYDVWGAELSVGRQNGVQMLDVGPIPTLVTGLEKPVAAWRLACALEKSRIASALGKRQPNSLEFANVLDDIVEGNVVLVGPPGWTLQPQHADFRLAKGERLKLPLEITLPMNSATGGQVVRADFEITVPRGYRFSAYFPVEVGFPDVQLDVATHVNTRGELEVEQRLTNLSETPLSFRCNLFAPDHRRQSLHVSGLDRGSDVRTYHLPNGKSLVGKLLWLQVEEVNGTRTLNHRFTAEP